MSVGRDTTGIRYHTERLEKHDYLKYTYMYTYFVRPDFFISWLTGFSLDLESGGGGGAKKINKKTPLKMTS